MIHFSGTVLDHLFATYGYWVVLLFVAIESMGIPFPGETTLIAAALYAGTTHRLDIGLVITAAAAGAILGDNLGYVIGREGGFRLLRRIGPYIRLNERHLKLGQYLFYKHGGKVVFFGRFVSVLRAWAAFLAGVDRMHWRPFFAYNAAGGILWATLYGMGAYLLGSHIEQIAGPVGIGFGVIGAIVIVAALVFVWRNERRLEDEAVRALPGPLYQRGLPEKSRPEHDTRSPRSDLRAVRPVGGGAARPGTGAQKASAHRPGTQKPPVSGNRRRGQGTRRRRASSPGPARRRMSRSRKR